MESAVCFLWRAFGRLQPEAVMMIKLIIVLVLLQALTAFAVEVDSSEGPGAAETVKKLASGTLNLNDLKIPKEFEDFDGVKDMVPEMINALKNITDKEYDDNGEMTCIEVMKRLGFKVGMAVDSCMREMQLTVGKLRKEIREVLPCMVRCVGTKMNVFKEDGTFNYGYAPQLLADHIPPRMHTIVANVLQTCFGHVKEINANDSTCKTYRPVMMCLVRSGFQVVDQVLDLCPDIPDVFKRAARRMVKNKRNQERITRIIDPDGEL